MGAGEISGGEIGSAGALEKEGSGEGDDRRVHPVRGVASGAVRAERGVAARWAGWVAGPVVSGTERVQRGATRAKRGGKREWAARLGLGRSLGAGWTRERLGRAGLDAVESWAGVGREVGCGLG